MPYPTGIIGFVRIPDSIDPNKVYAIGPGGRPVNNEQDLMALTGAKTVAEAWQLANVQLVSPEDALNKYNVTDAKAKRAGTTTPTTTTSTPEYPTAESFYNKTPTTSTQKPYIRNPNSNDVYDRNGNWITAEQAAQIPDFWNQVEITESAPITNKWQEEAREYDTGNEDLNAILDSINDVLITITDSGQIVNPNIDITPELVKQWADQASAELDPYYKSQFDAIKDDLSTDLTYLSDQYKQAMESSQAAFKRNLESQRETEAGAGTIFSGGRMTREQELAQAAERSMTGLGTNLAYQAGKAGTAAERTIGSGGLAGLTSPTYSSYLASTTGMGGFTPLEARTLFSPTGGITGTMEREKIEKKRAYSDLLKGYWLAEHNV